jgi:hypothetical protein
LNEAGNNIGTVSFSLSAGEQLEAEAGDLFRWGFDTLTVGSIRAVYDGAGVLGDVVFGEPYDSVYLAALPLQTTGFTEAIFCQVANGAGYWTGLALYNPNAQAADVTMQVYSPTGIKIAEGHKTMAAGTRLSKLVPELVPSSQGQVGGYVVISSTQPLIAQQLFGDGDTNMMSAVPPTIVR